MTAAGSTAIPWLKPSPAIEAAAEAHFALLHRLNRCDLEAEAAGRKLRGRELQAFARPIERQLDDAEKRLKRLLKGGAVKTEKWTVGHVEIGGRVHFVAVKRGQRGTA